MLEILSTMCHSVGKKLTNVFNLELTLSLTGKLQIYSIFFEKREETFKTGNGALMKRNLCVELFFFAQATCENSELLQSAVKGKRPGLQESNSFFESYTHTHFKIQQIFFPPKTPSLALLAKL